MILLGLPSSTKPRMRRCRGVRLARRVAASVRELDRCEVSGDLASARSMLAISSSSPTGLLMKSAAPEASAA